MNERDIIQCLLARCGVEQNGLLRGIGDDCAVIEKNEQRSWLVTMDTLVESVHFDLNWHPPEKLGRKAVAVNVSDIAAMGGEPVFIFLSLGLPRGFDPSWMNSFSQGITGACREYGCMLAGGDTVMSREGVLITVTVIGEVPADQVVYRRGAFPGDVIWVSGSLGMAAAGLEICRNGITSAVTSLQPLVEAHLNPQPRVRLGRQLAESRIVHAMMDISDGLATDLSHLCAQSGVGAQIYSDRLQASPALLEATSLLRQDPIDLMIRGGEDYELVFTSSPDAESEIAALAESTGVAVTAIGTIVNQQGVRLVLSASDTEQQGEIDISFAGYDHFPDE